MSCSFRSALLLLAIAALGMACAPIGSAQPRRAAQIDPANYRIHLRLARSGNRAQRCEHARAAHALFPSAEAARDLMCR